MRGASQARPLSPQAAGAAGDAALNAGACDVVRGPVEEWKRARCVSCGGAGPCQSTSSLLLGVAEIVQARSGLEALDRLEELREVALAEAAAAAGLLDHVRGDLAHAAHALDDLEEDGGTIADRLCENLQEHALVVLVDKHAELLRLGVLLLGEGATNLGGEVGVVLLAGLGHEIEAAAVRHRAHGAQRGEEVVALEGEVLQARAVVLLEVGLNLRLAAGAECGLVDGKQHHLLVVREHHRVEAAVHGADVLRGELGELMEAGEARHVVDDLQEVGHVADGVVEAPDAERVLLAARVAALPARRALVARQERALEALLQLHVPQHDLAVQLDLSDDRLVLAHGGGRQHRARAIGHGGGKCVRRVVHRHAHGAHGHAVRLEEVARVLLRVARHGGSGARVDLRSSVRLPLVALAAVGRGEDEHELGRLGHVRSRRVVARRLVRKRDEVHAEARAEATAGVDRISAKELDVVEAVRRELVGLGVVALEVGGAYQFDRRARGLGLALRRRRWR
mmetsp:Transcript_12638/g.53150  ORF Transcript_12638/g.53150 Transcript_12638/m.53150 type:complete len:510 (-) Transcript_12638:66-1595(-)